VYFSSPRVLLTWSAMTRVNADSVPPADRIQYLFRLKQLLDENFEDIARIISTENGKTLAEARGELRRGIENVEVACGIPILMQGYNLEDVARGIDESMFRQPLGVVAAITPFNFPAMIPLWFLPYAVACGNTFVLKPSERVPFSMVRIFELIHRAGVPKGVLNLVNGGKTAVDALLDSRQHVFHRLLPQRQRLRAHLVRDAGVERPPLRQVHRDLRRVLGEIVRGLDGALVDEIDSGPQRVGERPEARRRQPHVNDALDRIVGIPDASIAGRRQAVDAGWIDLDCRKAPEGKVGAPAVHAAGGVGGRTT